MSSISKQSGSVDSTQGQIHSYTPLQQQGHIRVINLEPSPSVDAPLQISFVADHHSTLEGRYEAISYTWGEPDVSYPLHLPDSTYVGVTKNLDWALRRFRLHDRTRFLWADAVCINQNDDREKETQIPLMVVIFQGASKVLASLGVGGAEEVGMRTLEGWSRRWRESDGNGSPWEVTGFQRDELESLYFAKPDRGSFEPVDDLYTPEVLGVVRFLRLKWFSRLWIVQEVVFNVDVVLVFGLAELSWARLTVALLYLKTVLNRKGIQMPKNGVDEQKVDAILAMSDLWKRHCGFMRSELSFSTGRMSIMRLLQTFQSHDCSDGRDRIYALYSMAYDLAPANEAQGLESIESERLCMAIDYSLDVQQTFTAFVAACAFPCTPTSPRHTICGADEHMETVHGTVLFGSVLARQYSPRLPGWPTWLPDWRNRPLIPESKLRKVENVHFLQMLPENSCKISLQSICIWNILFNELDLPDIHDRQVHPIVAHKWAIARSKGKIHKSLRNIYPREPNSRHVDCHPRSIPSMFETVWPVKDLATSFGLLGLLRDWDCSWGSAKPRNRLESRAIFYLQEASEHLCFVEAKTGTYTFFGVGNKALEEGDEMILYHVDQGKRLLDRNRFDALLVRPVLSAEDEDATAKVRSYLLLGTANVLGPFLNGSLMPFEDEHIRREQIEIALF